MSIRVFLIWTLSLVILAGMVALCVLWRDDGGLIGLIAGAIGFGLRYFERGQRDAGERLGNGYAGAILGLAVGFLAGAAGYYIVDNYQSWLG